MGKAYEPGNGVAMIAGHIDALTTRLKPTSNKPNNNGYVQLGVAQYAGALNETWWDRDLSIGGRVIIRDPETGKTFVKLAKLDWPSMSHLAAKRFVLRLTRMPSCPNSHASTTFWYRYDGPWQPRNGDGAHHRARQ